MYRFICNDGYESSLDAGTRRVSSYHPNLSDRQREINPGLAHVDELPEHVWKPAVHSSLSSPYIVNAVAQGSLIDHIELDTVASAHLHLLSVSMAHPHGRPAQEVVMDMSSDDEQPTVAPHDLMLQFPDSNYMV